MSLSIKWRLCCGLDCFHYCEKKHDSIEHVFQTRQDKYPSEVLQSPDVLQTESNKLKMFYRGKRIHQVNFSSV